MATTSDVSSTPLSGLNHIDALVDTGPGWIWLAPAREVLYYTFSVASANEVGNADISGGLVAFNSAQQNACLSQLNYISRLTGITFAAATSPSSADLHFAATNIAGAFTSGLCSWSSGWSFTSDKTVTRYSATAYVYLDNVEFSSSNNNPSVGTDGYETLLHELGHALGLKHPFDGTITLPSATDNTSNSVMSYTPSGGPYSTYSPYDIAALMWIYGGDGLGGNLGAASAGRYIVGTGGGDTIAGGRGNDVIDGGLGSDTAVFSASRASFTVTYDSSTQFFSLSSSADGVDQITNVEFFQFSDTKLAAASFLQTDTTPPTALTFSPADEATGVAIGSSIVVTFSEPIAKGTGNIVLKTAAGATIATFDAATSANLSLSGSTLTINPADDLAYNTVYKVDFAAGAIKDLAGNAYVGTTGYNFTTAAFANSAPTGVVTITGTPTQGQTLTASNTLGDVDGLGAISYQWSADGVAISGANTGTLKLGQSQVGKAIAVTASYVDGHGTAEAVTSLASTKVGNINDLPTGVVTISGSTALGQTLTASNTLSDLDGLGVITYQWSANGLVIAGATASTYKLTQSDVGKTITVTASFTDLFGASEAVSSAATSAVVAVNSPPVGVVNISGVATQGQVLSASNTLSDADGLGTVSYQWKAAGVDIAGATGSTLTLGEAQVGKTVSVVASYTDSFGTKESSFSTSTTAVVNVNDLPTGVVSITGNLTQAQTLTASNTLTDLDGLGTISYQWKSNGTAIAGATGITLNLSESQVGKTISVVAGYTDGHGTTESVTSAVTAAVANVNDLPTGVVTIAGTSSQGQILTAANTLADLDGLGTISYQWSAGNVAISAATANTLTIGSEQVGKTITVTASYTDGHGTKESVSSAATTSVVNLPGKTLTGGAGSESFTSTTGNDTIDGGGGTDTAIFIGTRADHTITKTSTGWVVSSPADGTDTLSNVERLKFSDSGLALDLTAANSAGGIYRLYGATFNRTPDLGGLGYWIDQADKGKSAVTMAIDFTYSAEFQTLFATKITDNYATGANITALVTGFYTNVLHRAPDAVGRDWYADQITTHQKTVGQVLAEISDSPENVAQLAGVIANGVVYTPWGG